MDISRRQLTYLWIMTGIVATLLVAATVFTTIRAVNSRDAGFAGYIAGNNSAIYLRERPGGSTAIITILELGTPVNVIGSAVQNNIDWYHVQTETASGWIPADRVATDPPQ